MVKKATRLFWAILILAACGSTPVLADGGNPYPWCMPGTVCNN